MNIAEIVLILFLLIFAGFLAGTESALSSISRIFVEGQGALGTRSGKALRKFSTDPSRFLNVVLLVRKAAEFGADEVTGGRHKQSRLSFADREWFEVLRWAFLS